MYGQGGFNQPPNQGFNNNQGGFNQPGYQGGFNQGGFNQGGFNQQQPGYQGGFNQGGFQQGAFGTGPRDSQIMQVVSQLFPMYDQNRSGTISANEVGPFFTAALSQLGELYAISNGQASVAIKQCDYNQDGQLTPQECAVALKFIVSNSTGVMGGQWNFNAGMNMGAGMGMGGGFHGHGHGHPHGHPPGRGGW